MLVLNYGGTRLLHRYLPAVVRAADRLGPGQAVVSVVDNSVESAAADWLARRYPRVGLWRGPNRGLASFASVARSVPQPVLILCNNDVAPEQTAFVHLVSTLARHQDAFAVGPLVRTAATGEYEGCCSRLRPRWGLVGTEHTVPPLQHAPVETVSSGVVLAVRRDRFLALSGYRDAYFPGRYEDLELCLAARARGWPTLFEPRAVVHHGGSEAFRAAYHRGQLQYLTIRNAHLFMLRNACGRLFWCRYVPCTALRLTAALVVGQWPTLRAWLEAVRRCARAKRRDGGDAFLDEALLRDATSLPRPIQAPRDYGAPQAAEQLRASA